MSNLKGIGIASLDAGYATLNQPADHPTNQPIDLVWIGCPHASLEEIERIADQLNGRQAKTALWITAAHQVRDEAE